MSGLRSVLFHGTARASHCGALMESALSTGDVHPSLHYLSAQQADLWMRVHQVHAPIAADPEFVDIFVRIAERLRGVGTYSGVLALGPGGGEKERVILQSIAGARRQAWFTAIDASAELALCSVERATEVTDGECIAIVGDLDFLEGIVGETSFDGAHGGRVITAFGITPNLLPSRMLPAIRSCMRPGDVLVISANLALESEGEAVPGMLDVADPILSQYANEETRVWLRRFLEEAGLERAYPDCSFRVGEVEGHSAIVAEAVRDVSAKHLSRKVLPEILRLFFSIRFTRRTFEAALMRNGFQVFGCEVTRCGREGVWLCGCPS